MLSARVLRGAHEFDTYANAPDSAFARAPGLRLPHHPAFLGAIAEALYPTDAEFLVVEFGGDPWAVVPSFPGNESRHGVRFRVRGTPPCAGVDLSDLFLLPVAQSEEGLQHVLGALRRQTVADLAVFSRVPQRSHLELGLRDGKGSFTRRASGGNAWCDVSSTTALGAIAKHQWRNVERLERRAQRDFGSVQVESFTDGTGVAGSFERFLTIEDSGWKGTQGTGTSLRHDPRLRGFLQRATERFAGRGGARIDILTIDGRDAAAQLGFLAGDTWYLQKIGYQPEFSEVGPGAVLLKHFLELVALDPLVREVNFMTNPRWADRWHFRLEPCHDVIFHGRTFRGRSAAIQDRLKDIVRPIRDRLAKASTQSAP